MIICVRGLYEGEYINSEDEGAGFHLCSDPNVKKICEGIEIFENPYSALKDAYDLIEENIKRLNLNYGVHLGGNHIAILKNPKGSKSNCELAQLKDSRSPY